MHGQNIRLQLTYPYLAHALIMQAMAMPANIISAPKLTSIISIDLCNEIISARPIMNMTSPTLNRTIHVTAQHGIGMML